MYRNILISMLFILMAGVSSFAQSSSGKLFNQMGFLSWDVSVPMGNEYTGETSFTGGSFGFRKMLKSGKVSIGGDVSWNSFNEYSPRKTYQLPSNGAVTTDLHKYMYTLPLALTSHYYFSAGTLVNPYVGIGLGATYATQELYYNTYVSDTDQWGFLVRPEVGAIVKFKPYNDWGILVAARYNYSTNEQTDFDIESLQTVEFQLGISWTW